MSHFTKIKTNFSQENLLIKSIDNLKFSWSRKKISVHDSDVERDFCDISIKQNNGHEILFQKRNNLYHLVYDEMFWQLPITSLLFNEKINTSYALNSISRDLLKNGFEIKNIIRENETSNLKIKINALRFY